MPWVTRGLRNGLLTTTWPKRPDEYFDDFRAAVAVRDTAATGDRGLDEAVRAATRECPTAAITAEGSGTRGPGTGGTDLPTVDRGRCILCGRCVATAPGVFTWQAGSQVAHLDRRSLTVGRTEESDEALQALRTSLGERVRHLRRSVHIRHVDAGSDGADEWEVQALTNPVYDLHRLGVFFTASPRHADILLVTGIGTPGMTEPLHSTREAMPGPVVVIAAGVDAISGGLIGRGYSTGSGIGDLLDVDVWVPGSPASPFSLLHAILLALGRVPVHRDRDGAGGGA